MRADSLKDFVLDQLRGLSGLECRAMFGGFGLYADGKFFGIFFQGRLYFKTTDVTRENYLKRGMEPFEPPFRNRAKQTLSSYLEVPADVIENAPEFETWAREAVAVAGK